MINSITIDAEKYQKTQPFPYAFQDYILDVTAAKLLQNEILSIPQEAWDRYSNPFEDKWTLRDKYAFPTMLSLLFKELESERVISQLSRICGYSLMIDPTRNFWGVHMYNNGDKLDIHVDAGLHPLTKQKKQVTLGIYLSANWKEKYGCELEIWRGDSAASPAPKLFEKIVSIAPIYNRMILFTCNDYAWHGNPEPVQAPDNAKRIFITMSYLSENDFDKNKKVKAFFIARPGDPIDENKDKLRLLRADPDKYKDIYRV
jgi:Rps23 Pro-64 3,4-dihydroxylase Tpa1-like proline 4-hydroxylase